MHKLSNSQNKISVFYLSESVDENLESNESNDDTEPKEDIVETLPSEDIVETLLKEERLNISKIQNHLHIIC